jgi:Kelch motif
MSSSSRKKHTFNNSPANGLASQSTQQPRPVCTWSAHTPQSGPSSPSPFPRRSGHTLTATVTSTPFSELFLFGGYVGGRTSSDLYVFSTQDFSTTLLQTSGKAPIPRAAHGAALIGTTLLICGGKTDFGYQYVLNLDSVYLLNLGTSYYLMSSPTLADHTSALQYCEIGPAL